MWMIGLHASQNYFGKFKPKMFLYEIIFTHKSLRKLRVITVFHLYPHVPKPRLKHSIMDFYLP